MPKERSRASTSASGSERACRSVTFPLRLSLRRTAGSLAACCSMMRSIAMNETTMKVPSSPEFAERGHETPTRRCAVHRQAASRLAVLLEPEEGTDAAHLFELHGDSAARHDAGVPAPAG